MKTLVTMMIGVATWVGAADLPARYMVDDALVRTVAAGTSLTWTLYADPGCSEQVFQTSAPVDVAVISRLKTVAPKGLKPKPPKMAEVEYVLSDVATSGNLYLLVAGAGILPRSRACQPQAASVESPTGSTTTTTTGSTTTTQPTCTGGAFIPLDQRCWFLGAPGADCAATCATSGLAYDDETRVFAGSAGADPNCQIIAAALAPSSTWGQSGDCDAVGLGCFMFTVDFPDRVSRCAAPATTADATDGFSRRFCACH